MNNIFSIVSDLNIRDGETKSMDCPSCYGVKTFTATNNMGKLMWNCYKAGCDLSGGARVRLSVDDIRNSLAPHVQRQQKEEFVLPEFIVSHSNEVKPFRDQYGLDEDEVEVITWLKENINDELLDKIEIKY